MKHRRFLAPLVFALVALGLTVGVWAYWTAPGSGSAAAGAGTLDAPGGVTAAAAVATVHVTWAGSTLSNGSTPASGYYVTRIRNSDSSTANACGTSPAAPTSPAGTSCDDTSVPDGTYHYTVTAVYHSWTAASASSNNVTVVGDATPPAITIAFPASGGSSNGLAWSSGCTPAGAGLCGTATDSTGNNGVTTVALSIRRSSDGLYWNGSSFASASESFQAVTSGGTASGSATANWFYALALPADGSYTLHVRATDGIGNTTQSGSYATSSFTTDTTVPLVAVTKLNGSSVSFPFTTNQDVTSIGGSCGTASGDASSVSWTFSTRSGSATCSSGAWSSGAFSAVSAEGSYTASAGQSDSAGNSGLDSKSVTIDKTAPLLTVTKLNGSSVSFPYTTNLDVTSIGGTCGSVSGDASSVSWTFSTRSGSATCSSGTWSSGSFSAVSAEGSYTASASQSDSGGNSGSDSKAVTIDKTAPLVSSINRHSASPTNAASVQFDVTFSKSVTGVDLSDFSLVTSGVSGASKTSISGSGSSYTVTINTGSGNGTIGLNLVDDDSIQDVAGNRLGGTGAGNGNFTGQVYTIDKTPATVSSIIRHTASPTNATSVQFDVTFSKSVTGVDSSDFTLAVAGLSAPSITGISGSGSAYTVTVNTGSGSGTIGLNLIDDDSIQDVAGNRLGGTGTGNGNFTGQAYTIDKTAPVVAMTKVNGSTVTFPYATTVNVSSIGGTCTTGDSTVSVTINGSAASPPTATCSAGSWTLTLTNALSEASYTVAASQSDSVGNSGSDSESVTVDRTSPLVASINRHTASPTNAASVQFDVTFGESVTGVDLSDFGLVVTSVISSSITSVSGSGSSYTVTVNSGLGDGTIGLNLVDDDSIQDLAGNKLGGSGTSGSNNGSFTGQVYTIDKTAPIVVVTKVNGSVVSFPFTTNQDVTSIGGTCGTVSGDISSVSWSFSARSGITTCNAGSWSSGSFTAVGAEGSYTGSAGQSDNAGNNGPDSKAVTIDKTAPLVAVTKLNGSSVSFPYTTNLDVTSIGGTCGTASGDASSVSWSFSSRSGSATCSSGTWSSGAFSAVSAEGSYTASAGQSDSAGNSGSDTKAVTIDKTAPLVAVTKLNGSSVSFPFTTNQDVTSIGGTCGSVSGDAGSVSWTFSTRSGSAICSSGTWSSGSFSAISVEGSYTATAGQSDSAGNSGSDSKAVTIDKTAPLVASINRHTASPTNATSVQFDVTFSKSVTGVDLGDFSLVTSGVSSASKTSVSGSGASYTVTVNTGSGDGTIGLDLADDDSITDGAGNKLGGSGTGNGSFTGQVFTIDKTAPLVAVTTLNGSSVAFPYRTNQDVTSIGGTCGTESGDDGISWSFASRSGSATCSSGTWSSGSFSAVSAEGGYTATTGQSDSAGNSGSDSKAVTIDKTVPLVAVTKVNAIAVTFPYTTNLDVTSIGGTCGTASGDVSSVSWTFSSRSGSATCSSGTWSSGSFTAISAEGGYTATAGQSDSAGNNGSDSKAVTIDKTAPLVAVTKLNGSSVAFPFTTNQDVTSIGGTCGTATGDAGSVSWMFSARSGSATCSSGTWSSGSFAAVTVEGSYSATAGQSDSGGNSGSDGKAVTIDKTVPLVASINRHTASPTNATSVQFDVTFSKSVNGVDLTDFSLVTTGVSGASKTSISGSGASYTVTVSTGSGDGTIGLNLVDDDSIQDVAGNRLGGAGTGNGNFTGQVYTLDRTAPLVAVTKVNAISVAFPYATNQDVTSIGGTCGIVSGDVGSVSWTFSTRSGSATCTSGAWSSGSFTAITAEGSYTATAGQSDSAGNSGSDTKAVTIDKTAPLVAVTKLNGSSVAFPFTTNQDVTSIGGTCGTATGDAGSVSWTFSARSGSATCSSGTWSSGSFAAVTVEGSYSATAGQSDSGGNSGSDSKAVTIDKTAPLVASINRQIASPTNATSVQFDVTFSKSVTGVDSSDFALAVTGVSGASITGLSGSGSTYTVTINTGSGNGTIGLNLVDDDSIQDVAGNRLGGTGIGNGNLTGQVYTIDKTAPLVSSINRRTASPTNVASVQFDVTFSESVTGVDSSDFALAVTGVSAPSITGFSGSGASYTVTVGTGSGDGTLGLNLVDDDSIQDGAGNKLGGTGTGNGSFTGQAYALDRTAPSVAITFPISSFTSGWNAGCGTSATGDFCGTASDNSGGSGLARVELSVQANFSPNRYWDWLSPGFSSSSEVLSNVSLVSLPNWSQLFAGGNFSNNKQYIIRALATDAAGNTASASTTFTFNP